MPLGNGICRIFDFVFIFFPSSFRRFEETEFLFSLVFFPVWFPLVILPRFMNNMFSIERVAMAFLQFWLDKTSYTDTAHNLSRKNRRSSCPGNARRWETKNGLSDMAIRNSWSSFSSNFEQKKVIVFVHRCGNRVSTCSLLWSLLPMSTIHSRTVNNFHLTKCTHRWLPWEVTEKVSKRNGEWNGRKKPD